MKGAFTTGEGRWASPGRPGMAYAGRLEWLPFGAFTRSSDYSEGDLEFEPRPKLSLATTHSFNARAQRTGGSSVLNYMGRATSKRSSPTWC